MPPAEVTILRLGGFLEVTIARDGVEVDGVSGVNELAVCVEVLAFERTRLLGVANGRETARVVVMIGVCKPTVEVGLSILPQGVGHGFVRAGLENVALVFVIVPGGLKTAQLFFPTLVSGTVGCVAFCLVSNVFMAIEKPEQMNPKMLTLRHRPW